METINQEKKYFETDSVYIANTLSFLGFRYYKFTNEGKQAYSFINSDELQLAVNKMFKLKNEFRKILNV